MWGVSGRVLCLYQLFWLSLVLFVVVDLVLPSLCRHFDVFIFRKFSDYPVHCYRVSCPNPSTPLA